MRETELLISEEIKSFIIPLSKEERIILEESIKAEGCREPIIVWKKGAKEIIIDGHNRYEICTKNNIRFDKSVKSFESLEEVKTWMLNNQLGRRNLTGDQLSYYRGLKYLMNKKAKGGYQYVESKGNLGLKTSEKLSEEFNVSESTIKRDAKFAEGLEIIANSNPKLKLKILNGESKASKSDIQLLSTLEPEQMESMSIRNEADLYNKAQNIRNSRLDELESSLDEIEKKKVQQAQEILNEKDPIFLDKEERVKRIKGRIISAINQAIDKKDINSIQELQGLIEKLKEELFD